MRLTPLEVMEINRYLFNALKQKGFDVKLGSNDGYIKNVSKLGVDCLPGICHSYVDGKQEYSYFCLESGTVDPSDLGYHLKDKKDSIISKYSQNKAVKVDIRNYKRVIDTFVNELNTVYNSIDVSKMKVEGLSPKVKIKGTGDVFDGKEGIVESEKGDMFTVLVNFDNKGRKVRQFFKKENIERMELEVLTESPKSTLNEDENEKVELEVVEVSDKRAKLLADYLDVEPSFVVNTEELEEEDWNQEHTYKIVDDESDYYENKYLVLNNEQANDRAYESLSSYINDNGPDSIHGYLDYVDVSYMNDFMEEHESDSLADMEYSDIFQEALNSDFITEDDFEKDEEGKPDLEKPLNHIDVDVLREKLLKQRIESYSDGIEWFKSTFGEKEFKEFVVERGVIDIEGLIDSVVMDERGPWIANYDGDELFLGSDGSKDLFAYRID